MRTEEKFYEYEKKAELAIDNLVEEVYNCHLYEFDKVKILKVLKILSRLKDYIADKEGKLEDNLSYLEE